MHFNDIVADLRLSGGWELAEALCLKAQWDFETGVDKPEVRETIDEAVALAESSGDPQLLARTLQIRGRVALWAGSPSECVAALERALLLVLGVETGLVEYLILLDLITAYIFLQNAARAVDLSESLVYYVQRTAISGMRCLIFDTIGAALLSAGYTRSATRFFAVAQATRGDEPPRYPFRFVQELVTSHSEVARHALGDSVFSTTWAEGLDVPADEAYQWALMEMRRLSVAVASRDQ